MSVRMILLPVFVHVALIFVLYFLTRRTASTTDTRDAGWRDELELPVLFYLLTICAWQTQFADILFLVLAWVFVALRILNHVSLGSAGRTHAHNASLASAIVLAIMWVVYAARLLLIIG